MTSLGYVPEKEFYRYHNHDLPKNIVQKIRQLKQAVIYNLLLYLVNNRSDRHTMKVNGQLPYTLKYHYIIATELFRTSQFPQALEPAGTI